MQSSCYVVELSVQPGGSRWAEIHTYTRPDHVRRVIEQFCTNEAGLSAYHALWYGATLGIWVVQRGIVTSFIDLHPFIRVDLGGEFGVMTLDKVDREIVDELEDDLIENGERFTLELSWEQLSQELPALEEPILRRGEEGSLQFGIERAVDTYLDLDDHVRIGSFEAEQGEDLDPPFDLDAD